MNTWRPPLASLAAALLAALACGLFSPAPPPTATLPAATRPPTAQPTTAVSPTSTDAPPTATDTPALVVIFEADPTTVDGPGQCATLRWVVTRPAEVRLYGGEYGPEPGEAVTGDDSRPACPAPGTTAVYALRVVDLSGAVVERTVSVENVAAARRPPQVQNTAVFGASAGLIWNFVALDDGILQFQVQADPEAFTEAPTPVDADGQGIQQVDFSVFYNGEQVYQHTELRAPYCLLGGDGPCSGLPLDGEVYRWEPGGRAVDAGDYTLLITITLADGSTRELNAFFTVAAQ